MDHKNDCPIYHGGQCLTPVACASQPSQPDGTTAPLGSLGVQQRAEVPLSAFYMTLRDHFAAHAMIALHCSETRGGNWNKSSADHCAKNAYELADAMMAAR